MAETASTAGTPDRAPLPELVRCLHAADECPDKCMCPCDLCYLLRTDAYTGDAIDASFEGRGDG